MAKHYPANTVLSPKDCVDSVTPIYDGGPIQGEYSVAIIQWQGNPCIGIRWNITERELNNPDKVSGKIVCVGEPNSRGYATWFILPDEFLRDILNGGQISEKIREYFNDTEL
ncbi:MAG: hypothetical protein JST02_05115 [Bacteroidetes bacterium]|nr:hypothetical protein [Chitinophagales bacterium]MBS1732656.1 hypothetical protein [Bacteroidota bacterium]